MARKKSVPVAAETPLQTEDPNWWLAFLKSRGYISETTLSQTTMTETVATRSPSKVEGEIRIFAERLIYALCPPEKGYAPEIVRQVKSIYDVLEGRKDFNEWFTEVRRALSLKSYQLASVIYQCLEGLKSPEARQLREQWFNFIQAELRGYGMI